MKIASAIIKQYQIQQLRLLAAQQEAMIRHHENLVLDAMGAKQKTLDKIKELEAEMEAHEITKE